jgi:hypothetical protein
MRIILSKIDDCGIHCQVQQRLVEFVPFPWREYRATKQANPISP